MLEDKTAFSHSLPAKPEPYLRQQFKNSFVGGGVGAAVDGWSTLSIARHAEAEFPSRRPKLTGVVVEAD